MTATVPVPLPGPSPASAGALVWASFAVALALTVGSILLNAALGLKPCPLCYYQRTFAFAAAALLGVGVYTGAARAVALSSLALPVAAAGAFVAGWHVYLEQTRFMECPRGLFDLGTAPTQSLVGFLVLLFLLVSDASQEEKAAGGWVPVAVGLVVGAVLAFSSVKTAVPALLTDEEKTGERIVICRPIPKSPAP